MLEEINLLLDFMEAMDKEPWPHFLIPHLIDENFG